MPRDDLEQLLWRDTASRKLLHVGNIISFVPVVIIQLYLYAIDPSDEISKKHQTYFTPSTALTRIFWIALYILFLGFTFFVQFSHLHNVQEIVKNAIGSLFIISNLLSVCFLVLWVGNVNFEFLCLILI